MPASRSARLNLPVEEVEHQRGDFCSFVFEREMSRIEQMKLGIGQIAQVCAGALRGKDGVILAQTINVGGCRVRKYA
jgi:hypothetical protein